MRERIVWHLEVPKNLNEELEQYLKHPKSQFKTKSEFIRDAVRKKLRERQQQIEDELVETVHFSRDSK